jgi:hypothetical protein
MQIPDLSIAKKSVSFYFRYLIQNEAGGFSLKDLPADMKHLEAGHRQAQSEA